MRIWCWTKMTWIFQRQNWIITCENRMMKSCLARKGTLRPPSQTTGLRARPNQTTLGSNIFISEKIFALVKLNWLITRNRSESTKNQPLRSESAKKRNGWATGAYNVETFYRRDGHFELALDAQSMNFKFVPRSLFLEFGMDSFRACLGHEITSRCVSRWL